MKNRQLYMDIYSNDICNDNESISLGLIMEKLLKGYDYSKSEIETILSRHTLVNLKKGELFCEKGKLINRIGILTKGLLLSYFENFQNEIEVTRYFDIPINMVVVDFDAYLNKLPCTETIKAIENSTIYCINREDLNQLYKEIPVMNVIGRKIAEYGNVMCSRRILALQTLDTEQRFKKLYSINPSLFNRISKKEMASFLRMNRNLITKYLKEA